MNSSFRQESIAIRRLRVRGKSTDPLHDQLRLSNILSSTVMRPRALPQSAILCIRSLKDPLPGTLRLDTAQTSSSAEWENATIVAIERMTEEASRPILGFAGSSAESVLFADRSELLACLAIDWLAGELLTNWWWESLVRHRDPDRVVLEEWLESPESIPAALLHLAKRQKAVEFVSALPEGALRTLLQKILRVFGLAELAATIERDFDLETHGRSAVVTSSAEVEAANHTAEHSRDSPPQSRQRQPWHSWVPETQTQELTFYQQCFLGIGLTLQRAPAIVRSRTFLQSMIAWRHAVQSVEENVEASSPLQVEKAVAASDPHMVNAASIAEDSEIGESAIAPKESSNVTLGGFQELQAGTDSRSSLVEPTAVSTVETMSGGGRASGSQQGGEVVGAAPEECERAEFQQSAQRPSPKESPAAVVRSKEEELAVPPHESVLQEDVSIPHDEQMFRAPLDKTKENSSRVHPADNEQLQVEPEDQIETNLGGLFYLINLGLGLNLYSDFTKPLEPGLALPIWDFIELIGRQLLVQYLEADPVWELLARLAGRDPVDPPGRYFEPVEEWRIPAEWLKPFAAPSVWNWSVDQERLRVHHPEGFLILDVRVSADEEEQLARELQTYSAAVEFRLQRTEQHPIADMSPLTRWLNWLVPFFDVRLRRALGLSREADLPNLLFKHHARIKVTGTHLEIHLALDDLPVQIRFAGLDRDPGWVPAAGRTIWFRYF